MKAIYVRVSTPNQNLERQFKKDGRLFIDICSGSIPFMNRPGAIDLINAIDLGQVDSIQVNAVDRLGRNMNDILNTLKFFTDKGIDIHLKIKTNLIEFIKNLEFMLDKFEKNLYESFYIFSKRIKVIDYWKNIWGDYKPYASENYGIVDHLVL